MRIKGTVLLATALITHGLAWGGQKEEETMRKLAGAFPNLSIDGFAPSPVEGIFEVTAGNQIFYFSPQGYLFFGEVWSKEGMNLTSERREQLAAEAIRKLPLDRAVKIGHGSTTVIEFTDPDCPFCRKTDDFLSKRTDVTRYVFLFPLTKIHPEAAAKSKLILCSDDPGKTLHEVISGKFDGKPITLPDACDGDRKLQDHIDLGGKLGVRGTPALWINGKPVSGADLQRIAALIDQGKTNPKGDKKP
jgi:thiol:disulfide interchange protein DsbC